MKTINDILDPFKKIDKFGEKYTFKYKDKDKYSTIFGGILFLIIFLTAITISMINFIPFYKNENLSLQFYTVNLNETENIKLNEISKIGVGLSCKTDKETNISGKDLFDLEFKFTIKYNYKPSDYKIISMGPFNKSSFYQDNIETFKYLPTDDFQTLNLADQENILEGIYTEEKFSYFSITVVSKEKTKEHFDKINNYLLKNECRLQFYYSDITVDISNYKETTRPFIDSIFMDLNPHLFLKKNIFFMKYHFKYDNRTFPIIDLKIEEEEKIGFSRTENYFIYKGLDRVNIKNDNDKYAKIYIRVDNKKIEIKKKYQSFLEFYAENSALWFDLFWYLDILISIIYSYESNRILSKKLFIFEGDEDSKVKYLQYKNSRNESPKSIPSNYVNIREKEKGKNNITKRGERIPSNDSLSQGIEETNVGYYDLKNNNKEINQRSISLPDVVKVSICCCLKKKLRFKEQLIKQSIDIIEKKLDIFIYIRNMILLDIMYKILIEENNKSYINFLSRVLVYKKPEKDEKEMNDFYKPLEELDLNNLYKLFCDLEKKPEKERTEKEKKIVKLFNNLFKEEKIDII